MKLPSAFIPDEIALVFGNFSASFQIEPLPK